MNPISEKQLKANKENSKLGGVKTTEGKEVSKFNAIKHGILRASVSEYESFDYNKLYSTLSEDFSPSNTIEEILIERISIAYIKLMRVAKAETELMKSALKPTQYTSMIDLEVFETEEGYKPTITKNHIEMLSNYYSRYETSIENRMYKAINKLLELKKDGK